MKYICLLTAAIGLAGCSQLEVKDGDFMFRRITAGVVFKASEIEYEKRGEIHVIRAKKVSSDQVQVIQAAAEGAARGAASAVAP